MGPLSKKNELLWGGGATNPKILRCIKMYPLYLESSMHPTNPSTQAALLLLLVAILAAWLPPFGVESPSEDLSLCRSVTEKGEVRYLCGAALDTGPCPAPAGTRSHQNEAGRCITTQLPAAVRLEMGLKLSINNASLPGLTAVSGIGIKMATKIVASRPYRTVEGLLRVRGIGPKRLKALRRSLRL